MKVKLVGSGTRLVEHERGVDTLLLITGLKGDVEEDDSGDFEDLLGDRSGGSEGGKRSA